MENINVDFNASKFAEIAVERFKKALQKKNIGWTLELEKSLTHTLTTNGSGGYASILITFEGYGKFVDMGVGKGVKYEDVRGSQAVWNHVGVRGSRVAKRWIGNTLSNQTKRLAELMSEAYEKAADDILIQIANDINIINIEL